MNNPSHIPAPAMIEVIDRLDQEVSLAEQTCHFLVRVDTADIRALMKAYLAMEAAREPTPSEDVVERLMEPYRNKWIGDHEEMIADLRATVLASLKGETDTCAHCATATPDTFNDEMCRCDKGDRKTDREALLAAAAKIGLCVLWGAFWIAVWFWTFTEDFQRAIGQ